MTAPEYPFGPSATLHHYAAGAPDEYGNDTAVWTDEPVARVAVWGSVVMGGEVDTYRGDIVTGVLTIVSPVPFTALDEWTVDGTRYRVTGVPAHLRSPITGTDAGWHGKLAATSG